MKKHHLTQVILFGGIILVGGAFQSTQQEQMQAQLSAFKESAARSQKALMQYTWKQQTQMIMKGEVKSTTVDQVKIGADGEQQKTTISKPAEQKKQRGVKGKIVAKKMGELQEYMQQVMGLISQYQKPDPELLQQAFQAGRASLTPDGSIIHMSFRDYYKDGDTMTISLNKETISMHGLTVSSFLDEKNPVSMSVNFKDLSDRTNYMAQTIIDAPSQDLQVKVSSYDHQKIQ